MSADLKPSFRIVTGCVALLFLGAGAFIAKLVMSDVRAARKMQISTVTLIPPSPPAVKKKPPDPVQQMKKDKMNEQFIEGVEDKARPHEPGKPDEKPGGRQLGLDAEGTAGSDAFGLIGKKGGVELIGSGEGGGANYGEYGRTLEDDLNRKVRKRLEANGGIPKGNLTLMVQIEVDRRGRITRFRIISASGNSRLDGAVRDTLKHEGAITQAPPEGMPRGVNIRISSQG
ncbi:MAG TPA: TonB C-terminal domain-containing protein [Syntrophobacteraceae bacterium]|nr:TonB C-terminal domain-containing protein [Syntrophobacteraceae bacterium]